ncbi:hypothetical protein EMIHUDRAFT_195664 [Emiliania huxleyi CCMP1516]|uniref:U-box domain-containing protein n=2 Tax=Emiliania huxleyi TaxID=2903 RepID=A0A0D3JHV4_EMIH1|nr:hypothetical protein EMIHUDRAFT_195664 [Emiliania huxleyi CCMP1516]EOD23089.1 hypothetical protein EMIHUDRAFT_195664 [Emiliania huxleyi CCMP1516]|eukprot:XP_005775518.1 hypothetical protein EMIHUDRAFT_195664 [Emiliania huxleyi CCMP1516]
MCSSCEFSDLGKNRQFFGGGQQGPEIKRHFWFRGFATNIEIRPILRYPFCTTFGFLVQIDLWILKAHARAQQVRSEAAETLRAQASERAAAGRRLKQEREAAARREAALKAEAGRVLEGRDEAEAARRTAEEAASAAWPWGGGRGGVRLLTARSCEQALVAAEEARLTAEKVLAKEVAKAEASHAGVLEISRARLMANDKLRTEASQARKSAKEQQAAAEVAERDASASRAKVAQLQGEELEHLSGAGQLEALLDENISALSRIQKARLARLATVPDDFKCCITLEIMTDPVMAADGHSYERSEIERWLAIKSTSPLTREALEHTHTFPNHALRGRIQDWQARSLGI